MKALSDLFHSLVAKREARKKDALGPGDFPLTADGVTLSKPGGKPIAVVRDAATAAEIADRLNADEHRKEEDKWSA